MAKLLRSRRPRVRRGKRKLMRKRMARKRNSNNVVGGANTCKVIETLPSRVLNINTPYLITKAGITGVRAPEIAKQFGLYRIAKIIFTHKPFYDTYTPGFVSGGNSPANYATTVPVLYWKMNRYGDFPANFNGDYMRALGARPNRLDDKNVVVSYKPNILQAQNNLNNTTTSAIKITPWLSTDDTPLDNNFTLSTAQHYGHTLYVEGDLLNGSSTPAVCTVDIKIVYEFKNPRVVPSSSVSQAPSAQQLSM